MSFIEPRRRTEEQQLTSFVHSTDSSFVHQYSINSRPANKHFRSVVSGRSQEYKKLPNKPRDRKSAIISEIYELMLDEGRRFLDKEDPDSDQYVEVCEKVIKSKIGQALRDSPSQITSSRTTRINRNIHIHSGVTKRERRTPSRTMTPRRLTGTRPRIATVTPLVSNKEHIHIRLEVRRVRSITDRLDASVSYIRPSPLRPCSCPPVLSPFVNFDLSGPIVEFPLNAEEVELAAEFSSHSKSIHRAHASSS